MRSIVRIGDSSDHGGTMVSAGGHFTVNGKLACVNGDLHICPIKGHGTTSVSSSYSLSSSGKSVTLTGDKAGCGATLVQGSPDVTVE